jgi:predicted RNA-binding Zn-ribbon protein involved in translation (DUF1610 family)
MTDSEEIEQERERIRRGFQCPECHGVRVLEMKYPHWLRNQFQCQECGAQWKGGF